MATESNRSSRELIARAQAGDREAFAALARDLAPRLRVAVAGRIGGHLRHEVEVDDVLQETYARAIASLPDYEWRGEDSFFQWLWGIAENLVRAHADRGRRRRTLGIRHAVAVDPGEREPLSASHASRRQERFARLDAALQSLSPDHREVILLARIDGLQIRQIAQRLGRSEGAIKNLLLRALKALKQRFGDTESLGLPGESLRRGDAKGDRHAP